MIANYLAQGFIIDLTRKKYKNATKKHTTFTPVMYLQTSLLLLNVHNFPLRDCLFLFFPFFRQEEKNNPE